MTVHCTRSSPGGRTLRDQLTLYVTYVSSGEKFERRLVSFSFSIGNVNSVAFYSKKFAFSTYYCAVTNGSIHNTHTHSTQTRTHTSSPAKPYTVLLAAILFQKLNNVKLVIIVLKIGLWVTHTHTTIHHQVTYKNTHTHTPATHNYKSTYHIK